MQTQFMKPQSCKNENNVGSYIKQLNKLAPIIKESPRQQFTFNNGNLVDNQT